MSEPTEEPGALEKLLSDESIQPMTVGGDAAAGCGQPQTVYCIKPTCVRTNVVVGLA